jgi:hypothetical protein
MSQRAFDLGIVHWRIVGSGIIGTPSAMGEFSAKTNRTCFLVLIDISLNQKFNVSHRSITSGPSERFALPFASSGSPTVVSF